MPDKALYVIAEWDRDAHVWVATSDDIPGLVTESATIGELGAKLKTMVSELLAANTDVKHPDQSRNFILTLKPRNTC
jgi:hypothetical protein